MTRIPSWRTRLEYYRDLVWEVVKADLKSRHFMKLLGPIWWLLDPVFYALLFFFLTTVMFKYSGGPNYLLFLFATVVFWRWFSRSVENAPGLVLSYQGILRQTNFPATIILVISAVSEAVFFSFGLVIVLVLLPILGVHYSLVTAYLPLILLTQFVLTFALTSLLAVAGLFFRDLNQVIYLVTGIWFYLSPTIYPIENVPVSLRSAFYANPFATILPAYKAILFDQQPPNLVLLLTWLSIAAVLAAIGLLLFERTRMRFFKVL